MCRSYRACSFPLQVNIGRYQAPIHCAHRTLCHFAQKAYIYNCASMSLGLSGFDRRSTLPADAGVRGAQASSSAAASSADAAAPKTTSLKELAATPWSSDASNQLQKASVLFGSVECYHLQRLVVRCLHPTSEYHSRCFGFGQVFPGCRSQ
jgi:hypothetical protein